MTFPRDNHLLVMRLAPTTGPASPPSAGAGPVPLAVPVCEWLGGCDRVAVDHRLCAYHADKCRDLITEHECGDLEDKR